MWIRAADTWMIFIFGKQSFVFGKQSFVRKILSCIQ
jgi:hypothetical protein